MSHMNEFDAIIHSLGEHIVDGIGRENVEHVRVAGDELTGTAEVTLVLVKHSWEQQQRAIDKMLELREMFLDELSFDYRFAPGPDESMSTTSTRAPQLEFA